jgi:glycosyltransferase involved in cell wall biosynthesis
MRKILILTFYFKPDLCAGSFRSTAFIPSVLKFAGDNVDIEILTTMPNRYHSFKNDALGVEHSRNILIKRIKLPDHKSGMIDQSKAFAAYAMGVLKHTRGKKYALVFATSSRLFTAFLGAIVARNSRCPLYLDIRDIFTDTLDSVLENPVKKLLLPFLRLIENFTINSACKINLVSRGFEGYFKKTAPGKNYSFFPNGIDDEFLNYKYNKSESTDKKIILYAGNIGEGQGLERIVPDCAKALKDQCVFWIIGDGGTRKDLELRIKTENLKNVFIFNPVGRKELMGYYAKADYLFLHLNDYDAFEKVLPSKIFEFAATGKPILAGVSGYSKEFIESQIDGAMVFEPCNSSSFKESFELLNGNKFNRVEFIKKYSRKNIMDKMAYEFIGCNKYR